MLHPEDAAAAAACGVDGVFVSNHAGNVNDSAITAWDALPAISDAVGGKLTLIADTGIRRGSDVLKGACPRRGRYRSWPSNPLWRGCRRRSRSHPGVGDPGGRNPAHDGGYGAWADFRY